jgi:DNA topoisomerase-1
MRSNRKRPNGNGPAHPEPARPAAESVASAKEAGLHYVSDTTVGIARKRRGAGFVYLDPKGKPLRDRAHLARIRHLVIPPAWEDVWISPDPRGHIQAIGRDERRRKQYRYHDRWREVRDENKYGRMMSFVKSLPKIRRRIARDLRRRGMPKEKVLAAVVRLLETTFIRVGNAEYKKQNKSYGLTTLHNRHAAVRGSRIQFHFRGKSGVDHEVDLDDERIAKIVRKCQGMPGEELFCYLDQAGKTHDIDSAHVNDYLHQITGQDFTAKDFRTWAGTVLAAKALAEFEKIDTQAGRKKKVIAAVEWVASKLGNTRAVCRKCYIHPAIVDSYLDGSFIESTRFRAAKMLRSPRGLHPEETMVVALLARRLRDEAPSQNR